MISADAAASVKRTEPAKATYATTCDRRLSGDRCSPRGRDEGWLAQKFMMDRLLELVNVSPRKYED